MSSAPQGRTADGELDELLRPSVTEDGPVRSDGKAPWRLGAQVYVAVLGGALGVAIIAVLNARRLRLSPARQWAIAGIGVAGLAVSIVVIGLIGADSSGDSSPPVATAARAVGVVAWGGMYLLQRTADRVYAYHAREDEPYESLWGPGAAAVIGGALVEILLAVAIFGEAG